MNFNRSENNLSSVDEPGKDLHIQDPVAVAWTIITAATNQTRFLNPHAKAAHFSWVPYYLVGIQGISKSNDVCTFILIQNRVT